MAFYICIAALFMILCPPAIMLAVWAYLHIYDDLE